MSAFTHDRVITFGTQGTITLVIDLPLWDLDLDTLIEIRRHVDALAQLGTSAHVGSSAPTPAVPPVEPPRVPPEAAPDAPVVDQHPCGHEDCSRTFGTIGARAIHRAKAHGLAKETRPGRVVEITETIVVPPNPPVPALTSDLTAIAALASSTVTGESSGEAHSFECHTCLAKTDGYDELTEHTRQWHNRFPTREERRGDVVLVADDPPQVTMQTAPVQDDPPADVRLYRCDDCDWSKSDGRELFKHTDKAHHRPPHQWERIMRTSAERVAS